MSKDIAVITDTGDALQCDSLQDIKEIDMPVADATAYNVMLNNQQLQQEFFDAIDDFLNHYKTVALLCYNLDNISVCLHILIDKYKGIDVHVYNHCAAIVINNY